MNRPNANPLILFGGRSYIVNNWLHRDALDYVRGRLRSRSGSQF